MREVIYSEEEKGSFKLVASRLGMEVSGFSPVIATEQDLEVFAKAVSSCWNDHLEISRELISKLHDLKH